METTAPSQLEEHDFSILDELVRLELEGKDVPLYDSFNLGNLEAEYLAGPSMKKGAKRVATTPRGRETHAKQLVDRVIGQLSRTPNEYSGCTLDAHFQTLGNMVESERKEEKVHYGDTAGRVKGYLVSIGWAEVDVVGTTRFVRPSVVGKEMHTQLSNTGYFNR